MSNKMVRFVGSSSLPWSGQIFTIELISWIINANRFGELIEPVQISTTSITPTPMTVDPILEPLLRSPSPTIHCSLPCYPRRQINNNDLIASIDQVGQKLTDCLSIVESALPTLVQRRSPSDSDPSEADQETLEVTALPFGLISIAASYKDALRGKFTDQVGDLAMAANELARLP